MKICFLSFYSGIVNRGVETYVHELANKLVRLGYTTNVFQSGKNLKGSSYKTTTIQDGHTVLRFTVKSLKQIDPETNIIIPTNGRFQAILTRLWALARGCKVVISGQSGPGLDDRLNLWTFPSTFVGLTEYQCRWAKRANPLIAVTKIPNGVNLLTFSPKTKPFIIDLPRPIILTVAALVPSKRIDLAMKAVSKLKTGSLLIVGTGELEKNLSELGQKLLPGRFKIISLPHDKMASVYTAADLFIYPTVSWESFGISLVEAMASGLTIVTADDPIRREIVGKAGFFTDPTNTQLFADTIQQALTCNWNDTQVSQASNFSWDKISLAYDDLFKNLAK